MHSSLEYKLDEVSTTTQICYITQAIRLHHLALDSLPVALDAVFAKFSRFRKIGVVLLFAASYALTAVGGITLCRKVRATSSFSNCSSFPHGSTVGTRPRRYLTYGISEAVSFQTAIMYSVDWAIFASALPIFFASSLVPEGNLFKFSTVVLAVFRFSHASVTIRRS